ncbi:MAG TPA: NAD(P)H-dependent oxidoreductase subunit E [Candidatus Limnocylindrales bacterium]
MDLHIVAPLASPAERAAVDSVLTPVIGPASSGWSGGERTAADLRVAHGGHEARSHRDLVLPALHAVQDRIGWISEPALGYICRRLTLPPAEAYGIATFYALLSTEPQPTAAVHVCDDMACRLAGSEDVCRDLERELGPAGKPVPGAAATWHRSPCLGQCERAPAALFTIAGDPAIREKRGHVTAPEILRVLETRLEGIADDGEDSLGTEPTPERLARIRRFVPQAGEPGLRLLARVGTVDPTSLTDYLANGGYRALGQAIEFGPKRVIEEVITAEVLGRGGAAFPAGKKWAAAAAATGWPKYVVCNADEAEPGTFKDRAFLEEDPFHVVESMTIAGFATGAEKGYLYIRGEYPLGEARMQNAIDQARAHGLLGENVMNGGFAFDIEIRRGGGAYICGEGTALFESIEGKRGEPRNKAARSTTAGLFQKPTAVNNVETLANIPAIVLEGGAAYAALGTSKSTGHKLFSISGHVARPGVYEAEFGITLRDLIELAGGVPGGRAVKAVNLGGAAGVFVGPESLHMPLTFEHAKEFGATLGAGAVVVFDETTDLLDIVRRVAQFFRDESCGQCVPCRVGTVRQEELLARLMSGRPKGSVEDELALLDDLGRVMRDASICGLGQTANDAVSSALRLPGVLGALA